MSDPLLTGNADDDWVYDPATDEWFKWTDLLAEVARLAIQDGRRLKISDGPDGAALPHHRRTRQVEEPHRRWSARRERRQL